MKLKYASLIWILLVLSSFSSADDYLTLIWDYRIEVGEMSDVKVVDLNNDGTFEILATPILTETPSVYLLNGNTGKPIWQYSDFSKGNIIKDTYVDDIDADGKQEIAVGSKSDKIKVISNIGTLKWKYDQGKFVYGIYANDLDTDGLKEIIVASLDQIYVLKKKDNTDKPPVMVWNYTLTGLGTLDSASVYAKDINSDSTAEIIALYKWHDDLGKYHGRVYALTNSGKLLWTYDIDDGADIIKITDNSEILVGTRSNGVIALNPSGIKIWDYKITGEVRTIFAKDDVVLVGSTPYVYILDKNGNLKSKSSTIDGTIYSLFSSDIDNDLSNEIIVGASKFIYVMDSNGNIKGKLDHGAQIRGETLELESKGIDARAITSADIDKKYPEEIVVGYGWVEDVLDKNFYHGTISVFSINPSASVEKGSETTISETTEKTETTIESKVSQEKESEEKSSGLSSTRVIIIGVVLLIITGAVLLFRRKKK